MSDGFYEMGFAKIDTDRKRRTGFAEVIFCQGKADTHLLSVFDKIFESDGEVLGTRCSATQAELIKSKFPQAEYDPSSKTIKIEKNDKKHIGRIAICTAGTADIAVAEEAAKVAEFFGSKVERYYDVGVTGLHRLLSQIDEIKKANVIIVIAGMEGALASVVAGLVSVPVIAVPTSIGYGASFGGVSALLTMINSCANGITVVNIDNGFGAAYNATMINRLAEKENKNNE